MINLKKFANTLSIDLEKLEPSAGFWTRDHYLTKVTPTGLGYEGTPMSF